MVNENLEKIFYNYLRNRPELFEVIQKDFFSNKTIRECYQVESKYYNKYRKIPNIVQLKEIIQDKKLEIFFDKNENDILEFNEGLFNSVYDVKIKEYDEVWLEENLTSWIEFKNLDTSVLDVINYLKTTKITVENIKDVVSTVKDTILKRNSLNLSNDFGSDFEDAEKHTQPTQDKFTTGFSWFDTILGGGFQKKTLVSLLGRPKIGKSLILGNFAAKCISNGFNCAYISLELSEALLMKRLGSNILNVHIDNYDKFARKPDRVKRRIEEFYKGDGITGQIPGYLKVKEFPTGSASVNDIEIFLQKVEEKRGMKFNLIVVDYLGILKNWRNPNGEDLYSKGKYLSEDLRAMAQRNEWAVLTAQQVNRGSFEGSNMSMSSVGESAAIIHTVDALIGITNRDLIDIENSEIGFQPLALRNAGGGEKEGEIRKFTVDYNYMRIIEKMDIPDNNNNNSFDQFLK